MDPIHYKELKVGQKYIIVENKESLVGYFMGEQSHHLGFYSINKPILFWTNKSVSLYKIIKRRTIMQYINDYIKSYY